jgi:biotin carboxylase
MTVLILHRGSLAANPYERWLADCPDDLVLLASQDQLDLLGESAPAARPPFAHVETVRGYDDAEPVASRSAALAAEYGVRRVIACQERDLERAAELREVLGLDGTRAGEVAAYRDKLEMKRLAAEAGLAVAAHAPISSAGALERFVAGHGLPVVVKPRRGAGSVGLTVLHTRPELAEFLAAGGADDGDARGLLAEEFVHGPMYHLDGFSSGGRIVTMWPSRYLYSLATFAQDHGGRMDVMLSPDDPLTPSLIEFGERTLAALPSPGHFAFHIEVFHAPDGRLVLCEAACRAGGASIREVHRAAFGFDPAEAAVRAELGLPLPFAESGRLAPQAIAGQLLLMKRPGVVRRVPSGVDAFGWVTHHRIGLAPGQVLERPTFSGDFMASFVAAAPGRDVLEARLRELTGWFDAGTEITGTGTTGTGTTGTGIGEPAGIARGMDRNGGAEVSVLAGKPSAHQPLPSERGPAMITTRRPVTLRRDEKTGPG